MVLARRKKRIYRLTTKGDPARFESGQVVWAAAHAGLLIKQWRGNPPRSMTVAETTTNYYPYAKDGTVQNRVEKQCRECGATIEVRYVIAGQESEESEYFQHRVTCPDFTGRAFMDDSGENVFAEDDLIHMDADLDDYTEVILGVDGRWEAI